MKKMRKNSQQKRYGADAKVNVSELLSELKDEQNSDRRAYIIRKLGDYPEPEVIKTLWDLRNNLDNEDDDFVQYEIKLSLHKVTEHSTIDFDFFLKNLAVFKPKENKSSSSKIVIDADLILEFLLRDNTTNRDSIKVIELILTGRIDPYIGKNGLRNIWFEIQELRGKEYANRFIIELLSKFNVAEVNSQIIDLEKFPTISLKTIIQIEIARQYSLNGIISLRDKDFIGSGYPFVYAPAFFVQSLESDLSVKSAEEMIKNLSKFSIEDKREKITKQIESDQKSLFEENLPLFQDWKIEKFEILCFNNYLTSATVIICNQDGSNPCQKSAFKRGSINALFTAFDEALSHIVEIKHSLESIYVVNQTPGKEGKVTAQAFIKCGTESFTAIYSHENIIKAYLFAYVQSIIAVYATDEYRPLIHDEKELMELYKIGMRDFRGLNFSQVNLMDREANLSESILIKCDFIRANLSGVNLTKANLTGADLSHAKLSHANLTEANLTDVKFDENNKTLFEGTILTNTIMPEIIIEISGKSRLEKVAQLLEQTDTQKSEYRILAVHCMTDDIWWYKPCGQKFFEVNKKLIHKGIPIQRVFILPESPTEKHLQVFREQQDAGIEVRYICYSSAKDIDGYDRYNTHLMVCQNLSVERNSFTTQMLVTEQEETGYISYKIGDIKTDQERFFSIWEQAEKQSAEANGFPNNPATKESSSVK